MNTTLIILLCLFILLTPTLAGCDTEEVDTKRTNWQNDVMERQREGLPTSTPNPNDW